MAYKSSSKRKTLTTKGEKENGDVEKEKIRILADFKKRLDSPNVKTLLSMGNNGPKCVKNKTMIAKSMQKKILGKQNLFPPRSTVTHLSSSTESEDNMDEAPKTVQKVHRRKTKSERNKSRVVSTLAKPSTSKKQKYEDVCNSKEISIFKKSVKSVERNPIQRKDKNTDKSAITYSRLTLGVGFGLFNRKKKSGTASKEVNYVNSELEIEVMPPEKTAEMNFDISNIYGKLKKSNEEVNVPRVEDNLARTPQSVHSTISLRSACSSNVYMDVDDNVSLSLSLSESFPSSPDFEAIAGFVVTHKDINAKFPGRDLMVQTKAELRQIHKMRNPNHDHAKDFRTPLTKSSTASSARGVSSEVVKRNLADGFHPSHMFSKPSNSTSTTQLNVLAHKQGVEAMHMQYQNQRQTYHEHPNANRDTRIMPSREDTSHVKLDLARTRLAENLDREVWRHDQGHIQMVPSPQQQLNISIQALTNAKTLLQCNERAAKQAKSHSMDSTEGGFLAQVPREHAPMDFLDALSAPSQDYRREQDRTTYYQENVVHGTDMDFEIFASTREGPHKVRDPASFEQLYSHNRRTTSAQSSVVVANRKVVAQFLPQDYNIPHNDFTATISQPWIEPLHQQRHHRSPRNADFLDYLEQESQSNEVLDTTALNRAQSSTHLSPDWKPRVLDDSPSPPHFFPHKMF